VNGGVSDAVTSEWGDRQSSHPVKNPASVLWQVFLPGVAYSGVRDNRSTLNTKTGYDDDDDLRRSSAIVHLLIEVKVEFI